MRNVELLLASLVATGTTLLTTSALTLAQEPPAVDEPIKLCSASPTSASSWAPCSAERSSAASSGAVTGIRRPVCPRARNHAGRVGRPPSGAKRCVAGIADLRRKRFSRVVDKNEPVDEVGRPFTTVGGENANALPAYQAVRRHRDPRVGSRARVSVKRVGLKGFFRRCLKSSARATATPNE
jgi:hypothetical protein